MKDAMPLRLPASVKPVEWVGSSLDDLRGFPREVRRDFGQALFEAQIGGRHPAAKPLSGFGGAGVLEVVADHDGNAYRGIYTVRFGLVIYVLHAFQKKSKRAAKTPMRDRNLIETRLKIAAAHHRAAYRLKPTPGT
jgi:phage-related protein